MKGYEFAGQKRILLDDSIYEEFIAEFEALRAMYVMLDYEVKYGWNPAGVHIGFTNKKSCGFNIILSEGERVGKVIGIKAYSGNIETEIAEECIMEMNKREAMLKDDYWKMNNVADVERIFVLLRSIGANIWDN